VAKNKGCDQCAQAVSWKITIKDNRKGTSVKLRIAELCGTHAKPLTDRPKTPAYEVVKKVRVKQTGFYTY
jgi:hypothetical protein